MKKSIFLLLIGFLFWSCNILGITDEDGDGIPDGFQILSIKILNDSNSSHGTISFFFYSDTLDSILTYNGDTENTAGKNPSVISRLSFKSSIIELSQKGSFGEDLVDSIFYFDSFDRLKKIEVLVDGSKQTDTLSYDNNENLISSKRILDGVITRQTRHKSDSGKILLDSIFLGDGTTLTNIIEYNYQDSLLIKKNFYSSRGSGSLSLFKSETFNYVLGVLTTQENYREGGTSQLEEVKTFNYDLNSGALTKIIHTDEVANVLIGVTYFTYSIDSTSNESLAKIGFNKNNFPESASSLQILVQMKDWESISRIPEKENP